MKKKIKIAIHHNEDSFSDRWIEFCSKNNIQYKIVNCLKKEIMDDLKDCHALMWHFNHIQIDQCIMAKKLIKDLELLGIPVFPNYASIHHYDNKIAQKSLLESINAPLIRTYIFFLREEAIRWSDTINYPIVFKLSTGAGSSNVKLIHSQSEAIKLINKSFKTGHSPLDRKALFKDRIWHVKRDKNFKSILGLFKGFVRLFIPTRFEILSGREKGYVYFQDFIPNNKYDVRIIVIGKRAFAIKRNVRKNDFRASGSGDIEYDKKIFDKRCLKISFDISHKLNFNSMAYDYVFDEFKNPLLIEISYCFNKNVYYPCPGYWDDNLNWFEGFFKPEDFMIKDIIDDAFKT